MNSLPFSIFCTKLFLIANISQKMTFIMYFQLIAHELGHNLGMYHDFRILKSYLLRGPNIPPRTINDKHKEKSNNSTHLGSIATVFQAEVAAISRAAQSLLYHHNQNIIIRSDSQAAIKAIGKKK